MSDVMALLNSDIKWTLLHVEFIFHKFDSYGSNKGQITAVTLLNAFIYVYR